MTDQMDLSAGAAWMKGRIVPISKATISVTDWGLTRSDITYDVVHVWEGSFFRLEDYLDRFMASMGKLRLDVGMDRDQIRAALKELVGTAGLRSAYVSMVASRGTPMVAGTRDPRACNNHFYAWAVPFIWVIPQDVVKRGAHMSVAHDARRIPINSVDPRVKNYHWGDMTAALFSALDQGFDTTVLLDHANLVTEGPGFNIFAVIDGIVVTPKSGMLEGVTRKTVLDICKAMDLPHEVRDITGDEFLAADEVFTATTAGGMAPVTRLNQSILGNDAPGPVYTTVNETYWDWHKRPDLSTPVNYGNAS